MKIWILNHYATEAYFSQGGRHHGFAKYLIRAGHQVKIFCANTRHNTNEVVALGDDSHIEKVGADQVPYVFVKTSPYQGNGVSRIKNMLLYAKNVRKTVASYVRQEGKPDVILASSVHLFTLVAGLKVAKKLDIPCICEIRDLWPESIVAVTKYTSRNIIIMLLYRLERWIYQKADSLIFTIEGGKDYIVERGWDNCIDLNKVHHINNGVDLETFAYNREAYQLSDPDLHRETGLNLIYVGSIRAANNVMNLVYLAKKLNDLNAEDIQILVYGEGPDRLPMEEKIRQLKLQNIKIKGRVDKKYIPYILSVGKSVNSLNYSATDNWRYGGSQNKLFEYFASGRPVLSNLQQGYNLIERYQVGVTMEEEDFARMVEQLETYRDLSDEGYDQIRENAKKAAEDHSFSNLTKKLIEVIEDTISAYDPNGAGKRKEI